MDSPEKTKAMYIAARRAQHRLKQRLETIEFEEMLKEEVKGMTDKAIRGKLAKITVET